LSGSARIDIREAQQIQNSARAANRLLTWTVYEYPLDYPNEYIARPANVAEGNVNAMPVHLSALSLTAIRALIPSGLYRLPRWTDDEPHILEVWI
jgi:hypothetical protein